MTFTIFYAVQKDANNWAASYSNTIRGIEAESKEAAKAMITAQIYEKHPNAIIKEMRARKTSK